MFTGPKRSTLQAMLASLGGNDDIGPPSITPAYAGSSTTLSSGGAIDETGDFSPQPNLFGEGST